MDAGVGQPAPLAHIPAENVMDSMTSLRRWWWRKHSRGSFGVSSQFTSRMSGTSVLYGIGMPAVSISLSAGGACPPHPRNSGSQREKLVRQGRAGYMASDQCSHRVLCSEGPHTRFTTLQLPLLGILNNISNLGLVGEV